MTKFSFGLILLLGTLSLQAQKALDEVRKAKVTYYYLLDQGNRGNCSLINDSIKPYYVAVNTQFYNGLEKKQPADKCGVCLQMTGENGSIPVVVVDRCPSCVVGGENEFDLSPAAYKKIFGSMSTAKKELYWREVPCPYSTEPIRIQIVGSNKWFVKLIIGGSTTQIASVELLSNGAWLPLKHNQDNGWTIKSVGTSNQYDFRITDRCGQSIVVNQLDVIKGNRVVVHQENFNPCSFMNPEELKSLEAAKLDSSNSLLLNEAEKKADYLEVISSSGIVLNAFILKYTPIEKIVFSAFPNAAYIHLYFEGKRIKTLKIEQN